LLEEETVTAPPPPVELIITSFVIGSVVISIFDPALIVKLSFVSLVTISFCPGTTILLK